MHTQNKGNLSIHISITIFFIHITLFESCFFFFYDKNNCRKKPKNSVKRSGTEEAFGVESDFGSENKW